MLIDVFTHTCDLYGSEKFVLDEVIYLLYEEFGVFEAAGKDGWEKAVPELSGKVTFPRVYDRISRLRKEPEDPADPKGRVGNDTRDAYERLLGRLSAFGRGFSAESRLFGTTEGLGIDEIMDSGGDINIALPAFKGEFDAFVSGVVVFGVLCHLTVRNRYGQAQNTVLTINKYPSLREWFRKHGINSETAGCGLRIKESGR
jgi:hypothetical protein